LKSQRVIPKRVNMGKDKKYEYASAEKKHRHGHSERKKFLTVDSAASLPRFSIVGIKFSQALNAIQTGQTPDFAREQEHQFAGIKVMGEDNMLRSSQRPWTADDTRDMVRRNAERARDEAIWRKEAAGMCRLIEKHLSDPVKEHMKSKQSYQNFFLTLDCVGLFNLYLSSAETMV
jgi:hypothetical protein